MAIDFWHNRLGNLGGITFIDNRTGAVFKGSALKKGMAQLALAHGCSQLTR
ncbi:hypothetical protein MKQ70_32645 [Chitinophaga sedimenti]|uniref:hypothetical protein n=1 Tax=Chitinophaga sedimenti TaxID=2033606 RepID=UPI00200352C2|nr:hypothetical protein [Chitinophaga sedimenti]MCK7559466.1 hypothetical protein [Chitinophaga sedimenti]